MGCFSFVSWNVRGASSEFHRSNIRAVVNESKASFRCIQETKCQNWTLREIRSLGLGDKVGWSSSPPVGLLGGLLCI